MKSAGVKRKASPLVALGRYLAALTAVVCLLTAMLGAGMTLVTSDTFARAALKATVQESQHRIEWYAASIQEQYQLSEETMAVLSGAAEGYMDVLSDWWRDLWHTPSEEWTALPDGLLDEKALTATIMADSGFQATVPEDMRRATARDEVAAAFNALIRQHAFPLRQSVMELLMALVGQKVPLANLLRWMQGVAGVALLLGLVLLKLSRDGGAVLMATGASAALLSLPVWLLNVPGLLHALNAIAQKQCTHALLLLGACWYATALALMLLGTLWWRRKGE